MQYLIYSTLVGEYDEKPNSREVISHYPTEIAGLSDRRKSRYYKINSHLLPDHHISVYLDACLKLTGANLPTTQKDIAVFHHPNRGCIYKEALLCQRLRLGNGEQIREQVKRYKDQNFPMDLGLGENCFIIRKNNDRVKKFNEIWWEEYIKGSERDQMSFMYAVWKSGVRLEFLEGNPRDNRYYTNWGNHKKPRNKQG